MMESCLEGNSPENQAEHTEKGCWDSPCFWIGERDFKIILSSTPVQTKTKAKQNTQHEHQVLKA